MSTLTQERRQEIVHAAHLHRNVAVWRLLAKLFAALKAQPRQRKSRWLAAHRGW
jgi:hypothetical protein